MKIATSQKGEKYFEILDTFATDSSVIVMQMGSGDRSASVLASLWMTGV
jgi:hypothetical protein